MEARDSSMTTKCPLLSVIPILQCTSDEVGKEGTSSALPQSVLKTANFLTLSLKIERVLL